jgi:ribosome-associated protein
MITIMPPHEIRISDSLAIPAEEVSFATSRSAGPGGQHVNKTDSRVTLVFDIAESPSLSDDEKQRLRVNLGARVSKAGVLRVTSQRHRSQFANKQEVLSRFVVLLHDALVEGPPRVDTVPSASARKKRLAYKRHRSRLKVQRVKPDLTEE